jgi:penicillin-binding protein 2
VYYYEMAQRAGIDNIERFAKACGFGHPTGIDLPHERSGLVPGKTWKMNRFQQPWQRGDTLNTSIGQGFTLVTPVQMAVFVSSLLNGGSLLKPSLVENETPTVVAPLPMPEAHRTFILDAMRATAENGTAKRVKRPDAVMGGKTGTAQVRGLGERRQKSHEMAYRFRDHAWFASWGKKNGKTYVVVVMVEHGGGGSSAAGPVCAKVYDALFGPAPGRSRPEPPPPAEEMERPARTNVPSEARA